MVERDIIRIDEEKCTGCGLCVPNCPEGAIQIIDGKARLISDLFCDGLGACMGHCPEGAIDIESRDAEPYDEAKVMENIIKAGPNTIKAHLEHLHEHGEKDFLGQAIDVLKDKGIKVPDYKGGSGGCPPTGCPGAKMMDFSGDEEVSSAPAGDIPSALRQWPVQLHLVPPGAPYFQGADVVLAADCVAYALGDFHRRLKGKALAIACPKLDSGQDVYLEKLVSMIDNAKINTLTVMTMEVPCCGGLLHIAKKAASRAKRNIPVKHVLVGIKGKILNEKWE
ncbi:MAG: 4Fe-4S binding protein [Candidatus Altiarchaeota archaeon]